VTNLDVSLPSCLYIYLSWHCSWSTLIISQAGVYCDIFSGICYYFSLWWGAKDFEHKTHTACL